MKAIVENITYTQNIGTQDPSFPICSEQDFFIGAQTDGVFYLDLDIAYLPFKITQSKIVSNSLWSDNDQKVEVKVVNRQTSIEYEVPFIDGVF